MTRDWMSVWTSAVNGWAGAAQGAWLAEMQRQQNAMISQAVEQGTRIWMDEVRRQQAMVMEQMAAQTARFWTTVLPSTASTGKRTRRDG